MKGGSVAVLIIEDPGDRKYWIRLQHHHSAFRVAD